MYFVKATNKISSKSISSTNFSDSTIIFSGITISFINLTPIFAGAIDAHNLFLI